MKNKTNQKGFSEIILILIIVVLIGVVGFFVYQNNQTQQEISSLESTSALRTTVENDMSDWEIYTNQIFEFSFSYPLELKYLFDEPKQPGDRLLLQNFQDVPGREGLPEDFQLALFVATDNGTKLNEFPKSWENELGKLSTEKTAVGGVEAIKGFSGSKQQAVPTVWVINNSFVYTFQLSTPNSTKAELFDQILSTFEFTE